MLNQLSREERLSWILRDYLNKKDFSRFSDSNHNAYLASAVALRVEMMMRDQAPFYLANDNPGGELIRLVVFDTRGMSITCNGFFRSPHHLNDWNRKPSAFNTRSILRFAPN